MKKEKISLEHKVRIKGISFTKDEKGEVTLLKENKGILNTICQKVLKKPRITKIHLDEMGSFIFPLLDGDMTISSLGEKVKEHFGDKAEPLYERLVKYIKILESYGFVEITE